MYRNKQQRGTKTAILLLISIGILSGCRYDVEQNNNCSVADVRYSTTITGIINSNGCLSSNCHGGANPPSGFKLTDYNSVKAKVTDGRLFGALNHSSGFSPMPKDAGKLSQCDINKVKAWIDAGAPNN